MSLADAQHGAISEEVFGELLSQIFAAIMSTASHDIAIQRQDSASVSSIPSQGQLVSTINIGGDWTGTVAVVSTAATASKLSTIMHGEENPDDLDRADALGEVANIIAGNAKGLVEGENHLDFPQTEINGVVPFDTSSPETWTWYASLEVGLITVHMTIVHEPSER